LNVASTGILKKIDILPSDDQQQLRHSSWWTSALAKNDPFVLSKSDPHQEQDLAQGKTGLFVIPPWVTLREQTLVISRECRSVGNNLDSVK
jgi:hypothetical protein